MIINTTGGALRILLINQAFYPDTVATAQHTTDLAIHLAQAGHEVSVLCSVRAYSNPNLKFKKSESWSGIHIVRVLGTGFGKGSFVYRIIDFFTLQVAFMLKLLFYPKQDVVIAFTSPPLVSFLAAIYCRIRGIRLVSWLMDINPDAAIAVGYISAKSLVGRTLLGLLKWSLLESNHVVVLDRWMKEKVIAKGVDSAKVIVVPPWDIQDPTAFDRPDLKGSLNPFTAQHGLANKFIVLYSGNLSVVHPLNTLLTAAVSLKTDTKTLFLFVGGGLRAQDVEFEIEKHSLENVRQIPYQSREMLPYSLSCADVHVVVLGEKVAGLVHTSKIYGTLMAGRPFIVISPRASHLGDLVKEVPGGFQVEHGDVEGFLNVLEKCRHLTNDEKNGISVEQRNYLLKNYGLKNLLDRFEREALACHPRPSESRTIASEHI